MEQVKKDIDMLLAFATKQAGNVAHYGEYSSIFLFGTENQQAINDIVDYKNKDVLTVASSGDQYISALYYGASRIDLYDINRFTYYVSQLKIAAIKGLSYNDFMNFMLPLKNGERNKNFWKMKTLKKLVCYMNSDVAYFWENALYIFNKNGLGNFTHLTDYSCQKDYVVCGMPFYLVKDEYYKLKDMLSNEKMPKFYLSSITSILDVLEGSYDIVYLSNIVECMVYEEISRYPSFYFVNENEIEEDKVKLICEQVMKLLKKDGTILMSYRPNSNIDSSSDLLYNNDFFESKEVPAKIVNEKRIVDTDIVLTYTPSKKGNLLV